MLSAMGHQPNSRKSKSTRSNDGQSKPVDWWFMYKIPRNIGPNDESTGERFLYCDNTTKLPANGKYKLDTHHLDEPGSAMDQTLRQIYCSDDPDVGYVIWNDELPEELKKRLTKKKKKAYRYGNDSGSYGHTKGVLAFNIKTNSGFYLLHSTPKFPAIYEGDDNTMVEGGQAKFGQTYLCITLKDFDTADNIAEVLNFNHRPQIYDYKIPGVEEDDALYSLINGPRFPPTLKKNPTVINVESRGSQKFRFFGKSGAWSKPKSGDRQNQQGKRTTGKDLWRDLVGPMLGCDLNVETWRNGTPLTFGNYDRDPETETPRPGSPLNGSTLKPAKSKH